MSVVRHAQVNDAPAVLELWARARSDHAVTSDRAEDIERLLNDTPSGLFVAEADDGEIVGVLIAGWDGWRETCTGSPCIRTIAGTGSGGGSSMPARSICGGLARARVTALVGYDDPVAAAFWDAAGYPVDHEIGRRVRNL